MYENEVDFSQTNSFKPGPVNQMGVQAEHTSPRRSAAIRAGSIVTREARQGFQASVKASGFYHYGHCFPRRHHWTSKHVILAFHSPSLEALPALPRLPSFHFQGGWKSPKFCVHYQYEYPNLVPYGAPSHLSRMTKQSTDPHPDDIQAAGYRQHCELIIRPYLPRASHSNST